MKKCSKCGNIKETTEFHKDKYKKDGLRTDCKECSNVSRRRYYNNNRDLEIKRRASWCSNNKNKRKEYYKENKENISKYTKKYREKNKNKVREYNRSYNKKRKENDVVYKFRCQLRNTIRNSFKRGVKSFEKKKYTEDILGCTIEEFKTYIEFKFKDGMSFKNHNPKGWHLDHIIPISYAKTEDDIIRLNHYTNFQPLWAEDNLKKSNKIL